MDNGNAKVKDEIALHLVRNHLQHLKIGHNNFDQIVNKEKFHDLSTSRVVAVIGAGASYSAGLPLADEAIKKIIDFVPMPPDMFKAELERLTLAYRLPKNTFETTLMALSRNPYTAKKTREKVKELYDFRYIPILCYEILAHLLKHRFIDAIINFNFDELLDQAISDELDKEEYFNILSDGDCPEHEELINPILERPIYIKPHGTVGHLSTLRFTREDYYKLPYGISELIENLLNTRQQLIMIVIGFDMQSFEFNKILVESLPSSLLIYSINVKEISLVDKLLDYIKSPFLDVGKKGLDFEIDDLWKRLSSLFRHGFKPRAIHRHRFVTKIFQSDSGTEPAKYKSDLPEYFRQRTIIEICLASAKSRGIVNIHELSNDRSGKYFERYKQASKQSMTFYELCKTIGYRDIGYSKEMLALRSIEKDESKLVSSKDEFTQIIWNWNNRNTSPIGKIFGKRNIDINYGYFKDLLIKIYDSGDAEIKLIPEPLHTKIFRNPTNILTLSSLYFLTYEMINEKNFKYLWVISEAGDWLTDKRVKECLRKKISSGSITLIIADLFLVDYLKEYYDGLIEGIYKLDWWKHNRHMTIILDSNKKPISSIYFTRRQRSSNITPVFLDRHDTSIIVDSFNDYKNKAQKI